MSRGLVIEFQDSRDSFLVILVLSSLIYIYIFAFRIFNKSLIFNFPKC